MLFSVNKKCHWLLAAHLMGDGSWRLHGLALKLGSIMPDVLLYTYVSGHKYDTTAEKVAGNLAELKRAGSWTVRDCFRLGYNLHFLEDYFTYPHNSHFEGGFIAHCLYEHRLSRALQRYLHENPRPAATVLPPPDAVCAVLEEHHSAYMRTAPSPGKRCGLHRFLHRTGGLGSVCRLQPPGRFGPGTGLHAARRHCINCSGAPVPSGQERFFSPCEKIRPSDSYSG